MSTRHAAQLWRLYAGWADLDIEAGMEYPAYLAGTYAGMGTLRRVVPGGCRPRGQSHRWAYHPGACTPLPPLSTMVQPGGHGPGPPLLQILQTWVDTVGLLKWNDPSMPHFLMDITGHGPSIWRTTTLWTISSETFWTLLRTLSRHLHGRQRMSFRRHMFAITGKMEQALQVGKVRTVLRAVPAVRAVLQESSPMFTHEALTVPGIGIKYIYMITDHQTLHNLASKHFLDWYARDPASAREARNASGLER